MKLGTVLAAAASAVLLTAQPVMAETTRSAGALPAVSAPANVSVVRKASKIGQNEDVVLLGPLLPLFIAGAVVTAAVVAEVVGIVDLGLGVGSDS